MKILNKKFGPYRISFNEDLTLAGIVKVTGRTILTPCIIDMENPYQLSLYGYAVVQFAGSKDWTLIDCDGNIVIKAPFIEHRSERLKNFQDFTVLIGDESLYGLYNPNNDKRSKKAYTYFEHCKTFIRAKNGSNVGALSLDFEEILKPEYLDVSWFSQDILKVEVEKGRSRLYRISDQKWSKSHCGFIEHEGYIESINTNGRGVIDKDDFSEILPAVHQAVYPFGRLYKGLLPSQNEVVGAKGWNTPSEEFVKIFQEAYGFIKAITDKSIGGLKYVFIDPVTGKRMINDEFDSALEPKGERQWAVARKGNQAYHIDQTGTVHPVYRSKSRLS